MTATDDKTMKNRLQPNLENAILSLRRLIPAPYKWRTAMESLEPLYEAEPVASEDEATVEDVFVDEGIKP
jgi:hypothetical protein